MTKTTKACLALFAASLVSSMAQAELYPHTRVIDVGFDAGVSASQNIEGVTDLLVEDLVINFTEIADSLGEDGLVFDAGLGTDMFVDINTGENKGFGFFMQTDGSMRFCTGKGLWDFLGHGNVGKNIKSTVSVQGDMFIETGAKLKFKKKRIGWTLKPSYYIPVFYIPRSEMDVFIEMQNSQYMARAYGKGDFTIYSNFDMNKAFDSDMKFQGGSDLASSIGDDITALLWSGGAALFIEGEYQLLNTLCVGAYADVPVFAGRLKYKSTVEATFSASANPILDTIGNDESFDVDHDYDVTLKDTKESTYKVRKPLRMGVEGAWRPFGDWCTFRPKLGFAARNPFGDDFTSKHSLFVEYLFAAEITAFYVLKLNLASIYHNQVFTQRLGLGFNFRVAELNFNIGTCGASFEKSWAISGLDASIGLRFGF